MPTARFFLYPVHVSRAFVLTRGLASALYLLLVRLLRREYAEAFRLCDAVASDTRLAPDELTAFRALRGANDDWAPDAHAVRLKLTLVTADSGHKPPWDVTLDLARYIAKVPRATAPLFNSPLPPIPTRPLGSRFARRITTPKLFNTSMASEPP